MKKFLAIIAIAGTMVACNNDAESTENAKDSIDSAANQITETIDSTADAKIDAVDSTAEVKKDSVEKVDSAVKN